MKFKKRIRQVKSKAELKYLIPIDIKQKKPTTVTKHELEMIDQLCELDPIFDGDTNKFLILESRIKWQQSVIDFVKIKGLWAEFGVREGSSIGWVLDKKPGTVIHGFDSWEGLPENWETGGQKFEKGSMAVAIPQFPDNVKLHKGWFKDTIAPWKEHNKGPIAYLHIDSDLYSSAKCVLEGLNDMIVPGTLIVFDEFCNFRLSGKMSKWTEGEWRALHEWLVHYSRQVKPVARSCMYQAAFEVIN